MVFSDYDQMIKDNTGLIVVVARRFSNGPIDMEDLVQMGRIALWKAAQKYDPAKAKFSTYAYRSIYNALVKAVKKEAAKRQAMEEFLSFHSDLTYEHHAPIDEYLPSSLTDIELGAILMKHEGYTNREIGEVFDYTKEHIRHVIINAHNKIRHEHKEA